MPSGHHLGLALLLVASTLAAGAGEADAGRHTVRPGQTLTSIAERHGCTVEQLRRANRVRGDHIEAGQVLKVPACGKRAARRTAAARDASPPRRVSPPTARRSEPPAARPKPRRVAVAEPVGESVGAPWRGRLRGGTRLAQGKGYLIRRPQRTWGTPEMVRTVRDVIKDVRGAHRKLHTLAVGDLSKRGGGWISEHRSHQSGRDIDLGLYFKKVPPGYPHSFAVATPDNLDRAATWDLLVGFARTADDPAGVEMIFLDLGVQGLLYEWALARGVDERYLDRLFQYPEGPGTSGLVRHQAHHADHLHIRFRCPPTDAACK